MYTVYLLLRFFGPITINSENCQAKIGQYFCSVECFHIKYKPCSCKLSLLMNESLANTPLAVQVVLSHLSHDAWLQAHSFHGFLLS